MTYNYLAFIIGGEGPDIWDSELKISAVDLMDAATIAQGRAEELGGWLCDVSQNDEDRPPRENVRERNDELKKGLADLIVCCENQIANDRAATIELRKVGIDPDLRLVEQMEQAVLNAKRIYSHGQI